MVTFTDYGTWNGELIKTRGSLGWPLEVQVRESRLFRIGEIEQSWQANNFFVFM